MIAFVGLITVLQGGAALACRPKVNLPMAPAHQTFAGLDDYLAYLKARGPRDFPFYVRQPNGTYRLITRVKRTKLIWTRTELMKRFGFSC
jgi:hypothetical protein